MSEKKEERNKRSALLPSWLSKYLYEYLDTKVIFVIDLVLSLLASILVLFLVSLFSSSSDFYLGHFSLWWLGASLAGSIFALLNFKTHKVIIRYAQIRDLMGIFRISLLKVVIMLPFLALGATVNTTVGLALLVDFLLTSVLLIGVRISMILVYDVYKRRIKARQNCKQILVYGTSEKSVSMIVRLKDSPHYSVIGLVVPNSPK